MVRSAVVAERVTFAVPGDSRRSTGGYGYDRRIIAELRRLGWQVDVAAARRGISATERRRKRPSRKSDCWRRRRTARS